MNLNRILLSHEIDSGRKDFLTCGVCGENLADCLVKRTIQALNRETFNAQHVTVEDLVGLGGTDIVGVGSRSILTRFSLSRFLRAMEITRNACSTSLAAARAVVVGN